MEPENTPGGTPPENNQPGAAPWAGDLASRFEDEGVRGQVDAYLRESWQPRMTQLEQQVAQQPNVPDEAVALFNDLMSDPKQTVTTLIEELFGDPDYAELHNPDVVEGWRNLLTPKEAAAVDQANEAIAAGQTPTKLTMDQLPDEVREVYEAHLETQAEKSKNTYETTVKGAIGEFKDEQGQQLISDDEYGYLHPFIQNAGGRLDEAFPAYVAFRDAVRGGATQQQAQVAAEAAAAEENKPQPPATLGTSGTGPSTGTPPTEKKYGWNQLEDAARDWINETRQGPPPVVGGV